MSVTNDLGYDAEQQTPADDGDASPMDAGPVYWAADAPEQLISVLADKERVYFDYCQRRGYNGMWSAMLQEYYGSTALAGFDASSVQFDGQEGELVRFRVNELRSHIRQTLAMNTKTRPAFKGVPTNSDYDSRAQLEPAEIGMEYVYKQSYGEAKERVAFEMKELFGTTYSWLQWDPDGGSDVLQQKMMPLPPEAGGGMTPAVGPDGQPVTEKVKSGTATTDVLLPWEQFCDPTERDLTKHQWRTSRRRRSKWELAAKYPANAAYIKSYTVRDEVAFQMMFGFDDHMVSTDDVIVKHFYHARTAALPTGRYVCYLGTKCLYDSLDKSIPADKQGLPTENIPIIPLQASMLVGSALGYSDSWDLAVLQQMLTSVTSDWATSQNLYGHPALVMDKGTDIDFDAMVNGAFMLTKPTAAAMPQYITPPVMSDSSFKGIDLLLRFFREISGLNATMRGDSSGDRSGAHAALYHSIALEFQNENIAALSMHREAVANGLLDILKRNATHPLMVEVVGYDERHHLQSFTKDQWNGIKRVVLEATKPVNMEAQMEVATFLQSIGAGFETKEQAQEFIMEGRLSSVLKASKSKTLHVEWENDQIVKGMVTVQKQPRIDPATGQPMADPLTGQPVVDDITPEIPVSPTHDPYLHVPEHLALLDGPEFVSNTALRQAVMAHVLWHMRQYAEMDPELCRVLRIPPPASAQAAQLMAATEGKGSPETQSKGNPDVATEQVGDTTTKLPKPAQPPPGAGNVQVQP